MIRHLWLHYYYELCNKWGCVIDWCRGRGALPISKKKLWLDPVTAAPCIILFLKASLLHHLSSYIRVSIIGGMLKFIATIFIDLFSFFLFVIIWLCVFSIFLAYAEAGCSWHRLDITIFHLEKKLWHVHILHGKYLCLSRGATKLYLDLIPPFFISIGFPMS